MPELPDITLYLEALERRVLGHSLRQLRLFSPFLLRTATPSPDRLSGTRVTSLRRLGKRIALGFEGDLWLVCHLMIAGRLHWIPTGPEKAPPQTPTPLGSRRSARRSANPEAALTQKGSTNPELPLGLAPAAHLEDLPTLPKLKLAAKQALFLFDSGLLVLTEAGTKRRASLHILHGESALQALNPGGLEVLQASAPEFHRVLTSQNHTLKRALTDPHLFSGIGNAYSDEILHTARLSPVTLTQRLSAQQIERLFHAARKTLTAWLDRLRAETGDGFPEQVTAFRPEMAVHGKFGKPCPVCGAKIQRIRYADNETNYCPGCQTAGKLLADRSLSLLLKRDWPKTPEELEELRAGAASVSAKDGPFAQPHCRHEKKSRD